MTNFEKYKDEILKIIANSDYEIVAVKNGIPVLCDDIECDDCDIRDKSGNGACVSDLIKWLYKDDGEEHDGCDGCKHEHKKEDESPCAECSNNYMSKWERRPKKTRQDEFLKHYPNANVLGIQPCSIEKENFGEYCGKYDECSDCIDDYWSQEVE